MKKTVITVAVLGLLAIIGIGAYALVRHNETENSTANEAMEKTDDSMMEGDSMKDESDEMMKETGNESESMNKESDSMMNETGGAMEKDGTTMVDPQASVGSYITYADYTADKTSFDKGDVVLFFNALWCPTCKALTKDITANVSSIPSGTTIVSVDYDTSSELKKKYGITYQHTFVKIDPSGNQLKKWSGSPTLSSLLSQI